MKALFRNILALLNFLSLVRFASASALTNQPKKPPRLYSLKKKMSDSSGGGDIVGDHYTLY